MWVLLLAFAWAGIADDVAAAANDTLPANERQAAFDRLVALESVEQVVFLAQDPNTPADRRWVAIRSLGPNQSIMARDVLLRMLGSKDATIRMAALGALGDRGDVTTTGYVASCLKDPAILVRASAAAALGKLRDPRTLSDLETALKDPSNFYRGTSLYVRRAYVDAMAAVGGTQSPPYLARALSDSDPTVAEAARKGLEKVAGFSYAQGRTEAEQKEAWRRWAGI